MATFQPEGNYYDKYHSKNPIVKRMMTNFFQKMETLLSEIDQPGRILEAGCGEGEVTERVFQYYGENCDIDAFDISEALIRENIAKLPSPKGKGRVSFSTGSVYEIPDKRYDLVICSEVLEHLEYPELALEQLNQASARYILLSVPREPIWRLLNMLRGKYLSDFGNTPGHIQHWSKRGFLRFLELGHMRVKRVLSPFPWTMVLIEKS